MGIRCDFCDYHIFHKTKRPTKGLNVIKDNQTLVGKHMVSKVK